VAPAAQRSELGGRPLRVAVVGLGYWGPNIVRVLQELPDAQPTFACDLRPGRLHKISERYPAVRLTASYDVILENDDVDAVAIATPVSTHFELAAAALEAGKHVLVEKPLAASSAEAEQLIHLAGKRHLTLMPGHTFLYSPPVLASAELISSGELGHVYFISTSRVNLGLHQPDVSVIWDLGPHDFSILRHWLGETPTRVSAISRSCILDGTPDVAFVDLEFPSATIAHVEMSWLAPSKLRRTAIVGSRKMVLYDDTSPEPIRIFDSGADLEDPKTFGEFRLTYRAGDILSLRVDATEPLHLELEDFCRAIKSGGQPRSSAQLGLDVVQIMEAVDRSLAEHGAPVELDLSVV
jgi:predicted dehydrogenase